MKYTSFRPGQTWLDTNGKRIQAHGGSVIYVDGVYYRYGENKEYTTGQDDIWTWGVRCYASTDLFTEKESIIWLPQGRPVIFRIRQKLLLLIPGMAHIPCRVISIQGMRRTLPSTHRSPVFSRWRAKRIFTSPVPTGGFPNFSIWSIMCTANCSGTPSTRNAGRKTP